MFDIYNRSQFSTVGELKKLLDEYTDDTPVYVGFYDQMGGNHKMSYFHSDVEGNAICFDNDPLEEEYDDEIDLSDCDKGYCNICPCREECEAYNEDGSDESFDRSMDNIYQRIAETLDKEKKEEPSDYKDDNNELSINITINGDNPFNRENIIKLIDKFLNS